MQIFKHSEFGSVRTIKIKDDPWFVAKDVAAALGFMNSKDAIAKHVDDDDKTIILRSQNATLDVPNRGLTIINESGLYSLIFSSKLPSAKKFKRWVTSEVLPSIRKHGHYGATPLKDVISLIRITTATMEKQGASHSQVAEMIDGICTQYGITLPDFFVHPEQMTMKTVDSMIDFIYSQPRGRGHKTPTYEDFVAVHTSTSTASSTTTIKQIPAPKTSLYGKIKELCKERGISISQLEKELKFSKGALCKSSKNAPSILKMKAVADFFGVPLEFFLD